MRKIFSQIALILLITILLMVSLDFFTGFLLAKENYSTKILSLAPNTNSPSVSSKVLKLNSLNELKLTSSMIKGRGEEAGLEKAYTQDQFGRRFYPKHFEELSGRNSAAIFAGCSFTFGDGLSDDETITYSYQNQNSSANVYNYGQNGNGIHGFADLVFNRKIQNLHKEKSGEIYYLLIEDQILRANGSFNNCCLGDGPRFSWDSDGRVHQVGSLKDFRLSKAFNWIASRSNLIDYFGINFSGLSKFSSEDYDYACNLLNSISIELAKNMESYNFHIVLYPKQPLTRFVGKCLEKRGVSVIDLIDIDMPDGQTYFIPGDGHPRYELNKLLAQELTLWIKNKKK